MEFDQHCQQHQKDSDNAKDGTCFIAHDLILFFMGFGNPLLKVTKSNPFHTATHCAISPTFTKVWPSSEIK